MISDHNNPKSLSAKARSRRVRFFASLIESLYKTGLLKGKIRILDIGGTFQFWQMNACHMPIDIIEIIEIVNILTIDAELKTIAGIAMKSYSGNALDVSSIHSSHYDIVHSNSLLEHVGDLSAQKAFASNVCQLGTYHFIQTPCRSFPIEPHFYIPFFAFLPLSIKTFLHYNFSLGFMNKEKCWLQARINCENTRLLTHKELLHIFPNSKCIPERLFMLCKSWIITNMTN